MVVKIDDIAELQEQIYTLEDQVTALTCVVNALIVALHEQGNPLKESLFHNMNHAAYELEEDCHFPEPAKAIDVMRGVLDRLLSDELFPDKKTVS